MLISMRLINRDFYHDEVYSMVHYIFVPFKNTVWIYKDFNNHFFFSLLNSVYVKVLNLDLDWLMERPYMIRSLPLCVSLLTVVYIHKLGKLFSRRIALFSVLLLITSLPFYYYTPAVRGYGLSVLLMTMLVYYLRRE